jgi:hypothetical protein
MSHLPPGTADRFRTKVLPLVYEITGTLKPWDSLGDKAIIRIWNAVFGNDHPIAIDDVKGDCFVVVKALVRHTLITHSPYSSPFSQVKQGISKWLHKFSVTAERALIAEFERRELTTLEERSSFVQFLLGDADNVVSKKRPFLWKSAYEPPENPDSPDSLSILQVSYIHAGM